MNKIITIAACLTATVLLHAQTTIFVTPNGTGDGSSWANACNLETAVASTPLSDRTEIWVQKGTYYPSKMLTVPDSVKIYGGFSGTENNLSQRNFVANPTIVDGQQKIGSIFRLENAAEINGFTIQNGYANGNSQKNGGGIWADENAVIENCVITNNSAMLNGGGVYAKGEIKIINTTIENNIALGIGKNMFGNCATITHDGVTIVKNDLPAPLTVSTCNSTTLGMGRVSFKTPKVWTITNGVITQEWSDAVTATACEKTYFNGGSSDNYNTDCREHSTYGHLFTWCAVIRFKNQLCPAPWRVPAREDFINLDKALGGNGANRTVASNDAILLKYTATSGTEGQFWGGTYAGYSGDNGTLTQENTGVAYWIQVEYNATRAYNMSVFSSGELNVNGAYGKDRVHLIRCVR